jgi:uncharacterized membrane protein
MSRASWIQLFLFLHVFGAIAAVGPTLTYGLWLLRAEKAGPQHRAFVLRTTSWVDGHLATPAFMVQAVTGVVLLLLERLRFFHTAWLLTGVAIYAVTAVFAVTLYAPVVRRQIALAERLAEASEDRALSAEYSVVAARARAFGIAAIVLTVAILYFMIVKPPLWSAS